MLRSRTRAVTSKQALMADHSSQSSSPQNQTKPIPSFFVSPRFRAFTTKGTVSEPDSLISPTSILEGDPFSPFRNPYRNQPDSPNTFSRNKRSSEILDGKEIGLALINTLNDGITENPSSKHSKRRVLFGVKLRFGITPANSPSSAAESGTKTRSSPIQTTNSPSLFTERISKREMELSEEYTCVISHGPKTRTTHIFNNRVVESHYSFSDKSNYAAKNFLSFCHTCCRNLDQKNDIYIYRGEKAFCSHECRNKEMLLDEQDMF